MGSPTHGAGKNHTAVGCPCTDGPTFGRSLSNLGRAGTMFARYRPMLTIIYCIWAKFGRSLAEFGPCRPTCGWSGTNLARTRPVFCRIRAKSERLSAEFGPIRSRPVEREPHFVELGPNSAIFDQNWGALDRFRHYFGRIWSGFHDLRACARRAGASPVHGEGGGVRSAAPPAHRSRPGIRARPAEDKWRCRYPHMPGFDALAPSGSQIIAAKFGRILAEHGSIRLEVSRPELADRCAEIRPCCMMPPDPPPPLACDLIPRRICGVGPHESRQRSRRPNAARTEGGVHVWREAEGYGRTCAEARLLEHILASGRRDDSDASTARPSLS